MLLTVILALMCNVQKSLKINPKVKGMELIVVGFSHYKRIFDCIS
uniref:Uncharacterized protein n=1 Tax=Anguilla anguilla TaxID=7936 RepID=A0A0E9VL62_ANGAN